MARSSHTIFRFKGVNYTDSVPNVPFDSALDSLNVYGDSGGYLTQFQQPTIIWTPTGGVNLAVAISLGLLPTTNSHPRLLIQQGNTLLGSDYPYTSPFIYAHPTLAGIVARLDHALCNGIDFFSNGQDSGYAIPSSPSNAYKTRYLWGISPSSTPTLITASTAWIPGSVSITIATGVATLTFASAHGAALGGPVYVDSDPSAPWPVQSQGLFPAASIVSGTVLTYAVPLSTPAGTYTRASYPSGITATTGWQYGACWGSSDVAHFSSLSPYGSPTGPVTAQSPTILLPPSPDWQVNEAALFRNQDGVVVGGGLWLLINNGVQATIQSGPFAGYTVWCDTTSDLSLSTSGQTAPYDNGIAPQGKYLAVWLDRVLMCGIAGDETGVRFTGYDTINFGRPQMSWPQYNEIKLGQGQAIPNGMGLLRYGGMVFFGTNGFMYIYRGTLNDISLSAPVSLSFYAEQMPYNIGLYSHFSIQSTGAGLVWLDDGFNLRVMDNTGFYPPKAIAPNLAGLFARMTPGSQDKVVSSHFDYLQRDWYTISFPIDGSLTNNMTVVVDVGADPAKNTGAWPVQHSINDAKWVQYPDGTGHLLALVPQLTTSNAGNPPPTAGYLVEVPIESPISQGVGNPGAIALSPPNPPMPGGYWRGGYFGIRDEQGEDEFSMVKMFRYCRLNGSTEGGLAVMAFMVNGEEWTWDNPAQFAFDMDGDVGGLNVKARALSPLILFPSDALATVTSFMMAWNETGER